MILLILLCLQESFLCESAASDWPAARLPFSRDKTAWLEEKKTTAPACRLLEADQGQPLSPSSAIWRLVSSLQSTGGFSENCNLVFRAFPPPPSV
ncbi:hypothetical protein VTN96DRAFT_9514 [Rasamsonia emersonii]